MKLRFKNNAKNIEGCTIPLEFYLYESQIIEEKENTYIIKCHDHVIEIRKSEVELI